MNSNLWIRKALSTCLVIATIVTYSMVTLASSEKIAGEILVTERSNTGEAPSVKVNGEIAQSGRSIFSSSTVATPENAGAIISLGKIGKIELAPNTTVALSFSEKGISGDLTAGRLTVLSASEKVVINTVGGESLNLSAGDSATATKEQTKDTTSDSSSGGGSAGLLYALILGGAVAAIVLATRSDNNRIALGGGSTVISPSR